MREVRDRNALLILLAGMLIALLALAAWSFDSTRELTRKDVGKHAELVGVARGFSQGPSYSSFLLCGKRCVRVVFPSSALSSFSPHAFNGSRVIAALGMLRWNKEAELFVSNARGLEVIK